VSAFDETGAREIGERAPHGDAGNAELVAQRLLGGERITLIQCAADDLVVKDEVQLTV
jgi:hypothetical protein